MSNYFGTETYKANEFNPVTLVLPDEEVQLPNCLVSIKLPIRIQSTKIPGRKGNVKEFISKDDIEITLNGTYNDRNEEFPNTAHSQLKEIYEGEQAIEIINPTTDYYLSEGQKVVVTNIDLPPIRANVNQEYTITLLSDTESELYV